MPRRPMGALGAAPKAVFSASVAFLTSFSEASVWDKKFSETTEAEKQAYAQEVGTATAGLGVGLSILFGFITFVSMLVMCCRCKRLDRADLAIAQAEADNDGKGLDDMYEIEDYEDHISKHRKILWGLSLLLFLGYLFCAGYAYTGAITADSSFNGIFDGTETFLVEMQNALCAENGESECTSGSVGDFMLDVADEVIDQLEGIVIFISSLSAVVTPLYWVSANLTTAGGVMNGTERSILHINDSITSVNLLLNGNGSAGEFLDEEGVDTIDPAVLADIDVGRDALEATEELTADSRVEVASKLSGSNSSIVRVKYQLDDINGNERFDDEDLRQTTLDLVYDDVLQPIVNMTVDIHELQTGDVQDARDMVEEYLEQSVQAVTLLIFLPGVILFFTSLCAGVCQSSKPLYLNMFFVFMTQIIFCLLAGVFLAIAKINGDVCKHHLELIENNLPNSTVTAQEACVASVYSHYSNLRVLVGVDIMIDYENIYEVLTCDGRKGQKATPTNNLVDIFEARQVFNISETLEEASTVILANSEALSSPKPTVRSAQRELRPLSDFVELNFTDDVDVTYLVLEIEDSLVRLPPSPLDWDSRSDQDKMDEFYFNNITEFSWNNETVAEVTYRERLESMNAVFGDMVTGVIGNSDFAGFYSPYNFTLGRNLSEDDVCGSSTDFFPGSDPLTSANLGYAIYTYAGQYEFLCNSVAAYANITIVVEATVVSNDALRQELEELSASLSHINGNITAISDYQAQMALLRDDMNASLDFLVDTLDRLVEDLNGLADDFAGLNAVVMGANNYTMCGFVGDFYRGVYLDSTCDKLQGNVEAVAGPALAVVILMFLSFCVQGCYGPAMRKRPRGAAGDFDGDRTRLKSSGEQNNLPTPHSPSPLIGNAGF